MKLITVRLLQTALIIPPEMTAPFGVAGPLLGEAAPLPPPHPTFRLSSAAVIFLPTPLAALQQ